jgi:hypothetical protein
VVISRLVYLTWIFLLRALMHWFPAGTYASIGAVIMFKNCVCVCVCGGGVRHTHVKFVSSITCSFTLAVCTLLWEHPWCVPEAFTLTVCSETLLLEMELVS